MHRSELSEKDRRRLRRKNHFVLDRDRDHGTRVIPNKKRDRSFDWRDEYDFHKDIGLTTKE
jgi:hypothetical protein